MWTLSEYTIIGIVAYVFKADLPEAVRLLGTRSDWSDIAHEVLPLDLVAEEGFIPLTNGTADQIKTLIDPWIAQRRPADHSRA